jgi:cardiolipin synthase A/B
MGWIIAALVLALNFWAAGHALMYKRDPKAAWGWLVTCLLIPTIGPVLYFLLGINRIKTRARKLHTEVLIPGKEALQGPPEQDPPGPFPDFQDKPRLAGMDGISRNISSRALLPGNEVKVLYNGNEAFPEMLRQIENARKYVFLATYIFETNKTGREFAEALARACKRGVDVRVMIDGIGEYYSWPGIGRYLKKAGVPFARFLPPKLVPLSPFLNLRNHRKMLIIDDQTGFIGGMNIGDRHLVDAKKASGVQDVQFEFQGPVISQMKDVFLEDWAFCKGVHAVPRKSISSINQAGKAACRVMATGPDQDMDKLRMLYTGMVSQAKRSIFIMTPYFLPSQELIGALQVAALKGVDIKIVLPARNNLPYVHWATRNMLWELLQFGIKVYYQPPPFAHSKLFLVDEIYSLAGSANMDPRSLRLNFEMVVEVYSRDLAGTLRAHFQETISRSRQVSLEEVDSRSIPVRLRDSLCWLFTPYL